MKKNIFLFLSLFFIGFACYSQPTEEVARARYEQELKEKKAEFISNIVSGFDELDEFQKHILTQQVASYYAKVQDIYRLDIPIFEKQTLVEDLNATHFKDFEKMFGEDFIEKLLKKVKGEDLSDQKKKKKKKRKKRSDN